ncbi:aminoglycoside phosphotransferase family protein [Spirillospora sp. NBC_01491]|uniref:aminoglycoside phosphotransferase family protein n=1 Tax=Spirillospora sp. NBC_01491 TaxID=2976007 RepID=UPI002E34F9E6|nr:aminoglycoside phosphotransferase family protein [Spirillospora sp. NBC_01491]
MTRLEPSPAIALACRNLLSADVTQARCLSQSPQSSVHRVVLHDHRAAIVKLHRGESRWKAIKERKAMEAVAAHTTLHTAGLLACGPVPGHDTTALITADLGEASLSQAAREGTRSRSQALGLLGVVLAQFHQLPVRCGLRVTAGWSLEAQVIALRRRCPGPLLAVVGPALLRAVELGVGRLVWCHGDLHLDNVLLVPDARGDGLPYVIDFEQMVPAVPEYDIAQSAVTSDALDGHELAEITAGYGEPLSAELVTVLIVFHVLQGWVYAALTEGRDTRLWANRLDIVINRCAAR